MTFLAHGCQKNHQASQEFILNIGVL